MQCGVAPPPLYLCVYPLGVFTRWVCMAMMGEGQMCP